MRIIKVCLSLILALSCINGEPLSNDYSNYSIFKITPQTQLHIDELQQIIRNNTYDVDFWGHPRQILEVVNVMVGQLVNRSFIDFLEEQHIPYIITKVKLNGYQQNSNTKSAYGKSFDLNKYNTFNDAMNWLKEKASKCKKCQLITIGKTTEGRNMSLIRIGAPGRKGVFIDAGIHAREWIAMTSALHLINILSNETDPLGSNMTSKFTFHIIPFANPDGYEYSRTKNRMWRKTRFVNANAECIGVDPNRNYPFAFGGADTSSDTCSYLYKGLTPFSIPETKALSNYIKQNKAYMTAYIAVHTHAKSILLPWGFNTSLPHDYEELERVGLAMKDSVKKFSNTTYPVMPGYKLYPAGGCSDDWAKSIGIKYSHTIEMGPLGQFNPEDTKIFPLSRELVGAVKGMVDAIP